MKYQIYKVDGDILRTNYKSFSVDFTDGRCFRALVTNTIGRNDNALFYQLSKVLENDKSDSFLNHLVYIDFSKAIRNDNKSVLKPLFDGKGLTIKCKDGVERTFVAFDKSNSMSKEGCIYFIDKTLKNELDKRLLLNFPFNKMKINSSQYFSYRGLYLSDSERIDTIELNEKKLIVIDDSVVTNTQEVQVITAEVDKNNKNELIFPTKDKYTNDNFNRFDGEGFISFEYAKIINDSPKKKSTSFQIRLPFAKGMVHTVDFKSFIKCYKANDDVIKVKDFLGIERNLDDVEIVLTKSMFKCAKWFKKDDLNNNEKNYIDTKEFKDAYNEVFDDKDYDAMKLYFHYYNYYQHSLYISGTNEEYTNKNVSKKTTLNYQFINTMALKDEEFNDLVEQSEKEIEKVNDSFYIDIDEEQDDYQDYDDSYSIYKKAVRLNPQFLKDPRISNFIINRKLGIAKSIGIGKLITDGENRFLSSDLLALMIHLYRQTNICKDEIADKLINYQIRDYRFYMPSNNIVLDKNKYYAILRNPHLSRNEEAVACPFIPEENSLLHKYFHHLDGIIMVGSLSLIPTTLGGADFDGDLVKIYSSPSVVNAVIRGCYKNNGRHLNRVLPIVDIPNLRTDSDDDSLESISYRKINDTFNSKIGLISNCSIRYGEINCFRTEDSDYHAKCSIIAGLEIDAAKKGWHPTAAIDSLQDEIKKKIKEFVKDEKILLDVDSKDREKYLKNLSEYFIKLKNAISRSNIQYKISKNKITSKDVVLKPKKGTSYLFALPYKYIDIHNKIIEDNKNTEITGKIILFTFEKDSSWALRLDKSVLNQLTRLVDAYNATIAIKQLSIERKYSKMNDDLSRIYTNLQQMYSNNLEDYVFDETGSNVKVALEDTFYVLKEDYLEEINTYKSNDELRDYIYDYLSLEDKRDTTERKNAFLILFNPDYNDNDNPIGLFKYIVNYVKGIANSKVELDTEDNEYLKEFETIINIAIDVKQEKKVWKENIINRTKEFLYKELFKDNEKDAVKYVYALRNIDKDADFFWDVLNKEDIVSLIQVNNNAG